MAVAGGIWRQPGYMLSPHLAVGLVRLPQPLPLSGYGLLWLDLGFPYLLAANGIAPLSACTHSFAIPNARSSSASR